VLVFVPVFNVDGHERFGKWNRPNQRGPEEMGWRTTAQNFNLNRDYVKSDSPEMQAMLRLVGEWDPIACVDLHVTDGAKFQHDVAIMVEPVYAGDEALRRIGREFRDGVIDDLASGGSLPARVLSVVRRGRRSGLRIRRRGPAAAAFERLLLPAQPHGHAGGDALVEGLRHARARDAQRVPLRHVARGAEWRRVGGGGRGSRPPRGFTRGQHRGTQIQGDRCVAHHSLQGLRVHAHPLPGLRRADDAL
jgi:hypothetical protein